MPFALQLPLDAGKAPVALESDEYGNSRPGLEPTRYNWLGAKQRSSETLTGVVLMGVRLYNPQTGRFLSADAVYGGNANAYDYAHAGPLNRFDLDGKWSWRKTLRRASTITDFVAVGACLVATAGLCGVAAGAALAASTAWNGRGYPVPGNPGSLQIPSRPQASEPSCAWSVSGLASQGDHQPSGRRGVAIRLALLSVPESRPTTDTEPMTTAGKSH
ncbi:RHS repeat-associated core domain-containing protein [Streptomyces sp. NPDC014889]|uniref:RHS repeat-associated core domain-containing protein n=1 Tax=Streptomyces sp. NPDC014889 TaxID=3364928 RepID=UPI0036F85153